MCPRKRLNVLVTACLHPIIATDVTNRFKHLNLALMHHFFLQPRHHITAVEDVQRHTFAASERRLNTKHNAQQTLVLLAITRGATASSPVPSAILSPNREENRILYYAYLSAVKARPVMRTRKRPVVRLQALAATVRTEAEISKLMK